MKTTENRYEILVIEDNPGDFALIEEFLLEKIKNTNILRVKNYKEAVLALTTWAGKFDIILLNLSLPDKSGLPLVKEITDLSSESPVIVLAGYANFEVAIKALSLGAMDYLLKEDLNPELLYKSILYSSERKKVILDLELSKKKYSELFHSSPQPMWVFDLETSCFLNVNAAAIKQYGYSREEFVRMTIKNIAAETVTMENVLAVNGNFKLRKGNGEVIIVETQGNLIEYRGRKAALIMAVDVTERLNYVNEIEFQNEKLKEISWIQSHIVRAPLARIMGLVQIFADLQDNDEKDKALGYLLKSAGELDSVIKEIIKKTEVAGEGHLQAGKLLNFVKCA